MARNEHAMLILVHQYSRGVANIFSNPLSSKITQIVSFINESFMIPLYIEVCTFFFLQHSIVDDPYLCLK